MNAGIENMVSNYIQDREMYDFFDINCWWDISNYRTFHKIDSFEAQICEMKKHGIKRAVITNAECIKYDPYSGNENTELLIKGCDNLFGCMVLTPDILYKGTDFRRYIDNKVKNKFIVARVFPKTFYHSMKDWSMSGLLEYLNFRRIPLIIWHSEAGFDILEELCRQYIDLPVIVEGNDTKLLYHNRNYLMLLSKYHNFFIETHNLVLFKEMEYIATEISEEKLVFGTYFPYNTPNASIMTIASALMDEGIKRNIAGKNLQRLIENIRSI